MTSALRENTGSKIADVASEPNHVISSHSPSEGFAEKPGAKCLQLVEIPTVERPAMAKGTDRDS